MNRTNTLSQTISDKKNCQLNDVTIDKKKDQTEDVDMTYKQSPF